MTTDERLRAALHELSAAAARQAVPYAVPQAADRAPRRMPRPNGRQLLTLGAAAALVVLVVQAFTLALPGRERDRQPGLPQTPTAVATSTPVGPPSGTATSGPVVTPSPTPTRTRSAATPTTTIRRGRASDSVQWRAAAVRPTSSYGADPTYRSVVRSTVYNRGTLTVDLAADGWIDLAAPDPTCLVVTAPDGTTFEVGPDSAAVSTSSPGHVTATLVYSSLQPGDVALRYACRGDYSAAPIGTLTAPARGTWMPARGQTSASGTDLGASARVESSSVSGRRLTVRISTSGSGLPSAEATCVRVTSSAGTKELRASSTQLTTDGAGNPAGTLTYQGVPSGVVTLVYGCDAGWSAARVGVLG